MRHNVKGRQFGRTANQRKALLRSLAIAVIEHERIETTVAKAKEARRIVEKLVTLGKRGDLNAKRVALAKIPNRAIVQKLFDEIAPRFVDRNGGYMRIVHTRQRVNDRADMAVLEFVDFEEKREKASGGDKKKAAPAKKEKAAPKEKAAKKEEKAEAAEKKKPAAKKKASEKKKAAPEKEAAPKKKAPAKKKAAAKKKTSKSE